VLWISSRPLFYRESGSAAFVSFPLFILEIFSWFIHSLVLLYLFEVSSWFFSYCGNIIFFFKVVVKDLDISA